MVVHSQTACLTNVELTYPALAGHPRIILTFSLSNICAFLFFFSCLCGCVLKKLQVWLSLSDFRYFTCFQLVILFVKWLGRAAERERRFSCSLDKCVFHYWRCFSAAYDSKQCGFIARLGRGCSISEDAKEGEDLQ